MPTSSATAIFEQLHALATRFRNRLRESTATIDPTLTFNGMRVLMRTGRQPGVTQKELVEHSGIDKAQMARIIDQLEDNGWLERRCCEQDRRIRRLNLTRQGRTLHGRLQALQAQVAAEVLQGCKPVVQRQLLSLLELANR